MPFKSLNKIMSSVSVCCLASHYPQKSQMDLPSLDAILKAGWWPVIQGAFPKLLFKYTPNPTLTNMFHLLFFQVALHCVYQWSICLFEYSIKLYFILKWKQTVNTWAHSNPKWHPLGVWSELASLCFSNLLNAHFPWGHETGEKSPFHPLKSRLASC